MTPPPPPASPAAAWRPWHPLRSRSGRFHWLLGLRSVLAFTGPMVVAHVLGKGHADAAVMSMSGFVVVLIVGPAPRDRARVLASLAVIGVLPAACLLGTVLDVHSAAGIAVVVTAGAFAVALTRVSAHLAPIGRAAGLGLVMVGALPATTHNAELLALGGLVALAVVVLTEPLGHPRVGLPPLPEPVRPPALDGSAVRRHAALVAVGLGLAGSVVLWAGEASTFAAHSTWMLLGVWIAARPNHHETRNLALQRGVGTLAGGVLTVALWAVVPDGMWIGWVFLALTFLAFGYRGVNYAWYCALLTPTVVIGLAGRGLSAEVLLARVLWTLTGVALVFVASAALARVRRPTPYAALTNCLAMTRMQSSSSAPSKIDSTRASTK